MLSLSVFPTVLLDEYLINPKTDGYECVKYVSGLSHQAIIRLNHRGTGPTIGVVVDSEDAVLDDSVSLDRL